MVSSINYRGDSLYLIFILTKLFNIFQLIHRECIRILINVYTDFIWKRRWDWLKAKMRTCLWPCFITQSEYKYG